MHTPCQFRLSHNCHPTTDSRNQCSVTLHSHSPIYRRHRNQSHQIGIRRLCTKILRLRKDIRTISRQTTRRHSSYKMVSLLQSIGKIFGWATSSWFRTVNKFRLICSFSTHPEIMASAMSKQPIWTGKSEP